MNEKPFNIIKATCPEFYKWLKEISRYSEVENFVLPDYNKRIRVYLYTHNFRYNIVIKPPKKEGNKDEAYLDGYLGCTVLDRKPIAGENWLRGRDLADGKYCYETWQRIKDDIIAFELVKIKPPKDGYMPTLKRDNVYSKAGYKKLTIIVSKDNQTRRVEYTK